MLIISGETKIGALGTSAANKLVQLRPSIRPQPMNTTVKRLLLAGAFAVAGVTAVSAADKPAADKSAAAEKAKAAGSSSADIQKLIDQLSKQRDGMLADRQKLLDQLKGATEENRKKILEQMQQQQKDFAEAMRELGKAQRDEARKLRENSGRPGGR